ncbi:hypothetical protein HMN09_00319000 [Mycena chlorophos]|uniref:Uncharacterized protein n=1 Tax=Mycena chlorophos TaxID=658473 RepID=A0A8H6TIV3_MYCCL|nr:hypothetical protein HMN09_00319000 [Mycena chlorophos]
MFLATEASQSGRMRQRTQSNHSDDTEYTTPPSSPGLSQSAGSPGSVVSVATPPSSPVRDSACVAAGDSTEFAAGYAAKQQQLSWPAEGVDDMVCEPTVPDIVVTGPSGSHSDRLTRVYGNVFVRGGVVQRPPVSGEGFDDILDLKGVPLVFKPDALEQFACLLGCHYPVLLRRGHGFGLPTFVSMLSAWLDLDYDSRNDPFVPLMAGSAPSAGFHAFYVLELDFAHIYDSENLYGTLCQYIHAQCRRLLERYDLSEKIFWLDIERTPSTRPEEYIMSLAGKLLILPSTSCTDLFVIIRNCDTFIQGYVDGSQILHDFLRPLERMVMREKIGGALLVSEWDDGTLAPCAGRKFGTPIRPKPSLFHLDLERTLDLTHHPAFQTAIGFTDAEIDDLERALAMGLGRDCDESPRVVDQIKQAGSWDEIFADEDWYRNQKTWTHDLGRLHTWDPSRYLEGLGDSGASAGVPVYPARKVTETLRKKYGFELLHRGWA